MLVGTINCFHAIQITNTVSTLRNLLTLIKYTVTNETFVILFSINAELDRNYQASNSGHVSPH